VNLSLWRLVHKTLPLTVQGLKLAEEGPVRNNNGESRRVFRTNQRSEHDPLCEKLLQVNENAHPPNHFNKVCTGSVGCKRPSTVKST
jgi:hypothetical protein